MELGFNRGYAASRGGILFLCEVLLSMTIVGLSMALPPETRAVDSEFVLMLICFYAMVTCVFFWTIGILTKSEEKNTLLVVIAQSFIAILYFTSAVAFLADIHSSRTIVKYLPPRSKRPPDYTAQKDAACAFAIMSSVVHAVHAGLAVLGKA